MFVATSVDRNYQTDFWHHLARGQAMAQRGSLVDHDLFTYTVSPEQPFQDANWLAQLSYYRLYSAGGLRLVQLANSLLLTAMIVVLVWLCWRSSRSLTLAAALGAFTFLGLWQLLLIRPQTYSLLLFVLLYGILEASRRRPAWLLAAPAILALWTNLHGGFPIGLLLIGCHVAAAGWDAVHAHGRSGWRDRRLLVLGLALVASGLATFVNPYGWHVYEYVLHTSGIAAARHIDEWVPPGLDLLVSKVWIVSVLGLIVLLALSGRRPRTSEIFLILCFLPLACGSVRMVAWWLLACAPILSAQLAAALPAGALDEADAGQATRGTVLTFALFAIACVISLPWLERYNPVLTALGRTHRPEEDLQAVVDRLHDERPAGRIFTRFEWGEYLGWALPPEHRIFMDGRIEIFPDRVWDEYTALTRGRADWQDILDGYRVDCLLLDTAGGYHADLLPQVERSPTWERAFTSGRVAVFLRRERLVAQTVRKQ